MKDKRLLLMSLIQILIGILGVAAFVVLALGGENMTRWYITLALAIGFILIGIMGLVVWKKS